MGDVVTLKRRPEDAIWVCDCGCTTHRHHADGTVECAHCSNIASMASGEWRRPLPEAPEIAREVQSTDFRSIPLDSAETFLKRKLRGPLDAVAIIFLNTDGQLSTWAGDFSTDEQKAWLKRKLGEAEQLLTSAKAPDA